MAVRDVQLASTLVCGLGWASVGFRFKVTFETTLASLSGQHAELPLSSCSLYRQSKTDVREPSRRHCVDAVISIESSIHVDHRPYLVESELFSLDHHTFSALCKTMRWSESTMKVKKDFFNS
jgi:hypothetical protein